MITANNFVSRAKKIATNYKTLYVMGCFGAPMNDANKKRYLNNGYSYNQQTNVVRSINAASADTFGFDCVCLIKGILWGWSGNQSASYGGAKYCSNGVPDIGADDMFSKCSGRSSDFSNIVPGEVVHLDGHIGIYIGDGLVVECTPKWKNKVQITAISPKAGYNTRVWEQHGKLPYVSYPAETALKVGDKVKVSTACKGTYDGKAISAKYVCNNKTIFTVIQIDGARVVIGIDGAVTAAVNAKYLTKV